MKNVIEKIKNFLKKSNWKYSFKEEDNIFILGIDMGNVVGDLKILILVDETYYNVYTILNSKVEEKYYSVVAEFLHRANYGLNNGNFELDYRDGEVRYKSFVNFEDIDVSEKVVGESIIIGCIMMDKYGKALLKVMLGEGTPKECVEECEKKEED